VAQAVNRLMYLARHSLTRAWVLSRRFGFPGGIKSDVLSRTLCGLDFP
jgi:hypothetical protein